LRRRRDRGDRARAPARRGGRPRRGARRDGRRGALARRGRAQRAAGGAGMISALVTAIPSPSQSVWYLGPLPLRAYALAILTGIAVATLIAQRRRAERGGPAERVIEIVYWAVPFGIVGGRIYHVISSPQAYFGPGGDPLKAFAIW